VQDRDYNNLPIVDELLAQGTQSIPYLIRKLDDETEVHGVVMDYWSEVTVADIALVILTDFFTDSTWQKTTIPGVSWDDFLERGERNSLTAEKLLRSYMAQHGRKRIQEKWTAIWRSYQHAIMWDANERCFRLRPSVSVSCPSTREGPIAFTATVTGVDANTRIQYVWRLTAGKIVSGQGSKRIVVDASVPESRGLTATVEILGFPSGRGNTASCSLSSH
jgi:predicted HNH restriction endonuclease